jgi:hypothetical protein
MLAEALAALSQLDPQKYGRRRNVINTRYDNRNNDSNYGL